MPFILEIIPYLFIFGLGIIFRKSGILKRDEGKSLAKILINISMPCLAFITFAQTSFSLKPLLILPCLCLVITIILFLGSIGISRFLYLSRKELAVFLSSATVVNIGYFFYPFFEILYGKEGLIYLMAFDVGNTIAAYTLTYFVIVHFSDDQKNTIISSLRRMFTFPPLWGILLGILYRAFLSNIFVLPDFIIEGLTKIGRINFFLGIFLLGIFFNVSTTNIKAAFWAIIIRMLFGIILGLLFTYLFKMNGLPRIVAIFAPGMPVGLTVLIYTTQNNLDDRFASYILSLSLIIGFGLVLILAILFNFIVFLISELYLIK